MARTKRARLSPAVPTADVRRYEAQRFLTTSTAPPPAPAADFTGIGAQFIKDVRAQFPTRRTDAATGSRDHAIGRGDPTNAMRSTASRTA
jgi:hypothetical protein